jgi:hypothetical protein
MILTPIFEWLAPASVLAVALAAVHNTRRPRKLGHVERAGWVR